MSEWIFPVVIIFASLLILMMSGMPIFLAFLLINIVGIVVYAGEPGLSQLILSMRRSIATFVLLPLPLFTLMGEIMFRSGVAPLMLGALDKWIGRMSGRLSLIAIASGTLIATMSGSGMASTAMLGELMVPEMEKKGYKQVMIVGPIMAAGSLAPMIPPSGQAIIAGALSQASIGKFLIAIIVPGLLLAVLYATYVLIRARLQPALTPSYDVPPSAISEKLVDTARYILPLALVIFLVVGVIILGIATPTEAAATGTMGTIILAAFYRKLDLKIVKQSLFAASRVAIMILMVMAASITFSQILVYSGGTRGLIEFAASLSFPPIGIVMAMLLVIIILGMFMNSTSIMMITLPIFVPVVNTLGFDLIWFLVLYLILAEMGALTPPFAMLIFTMQSVNPKCTYNDCVAGAFPFIICDLIAVALIGAFPIIALWLPGLMR